MGRTKSNLIRTSACALALVCCAGAAHAEGWVFSLTPYAWATDVGVDAKLGGKQVVDKTISVSDLLKDLDLILQGRLEAQHGEFGATADVFDVELSDEKDGVALPQGAGSTDLTSDMGMTIIDVEGLYDPKGDHQGIALLLGTRILNERATVDASILPTTGPAGTRHYETDDWTVDGLVGVRFTHFFTRHWGLQAQADASTGGTDYTWSASPSLNYAFGSRRQFGVTGGYRYMEINFEDNNDLDIQMTLSGALVGFRVSF